ncbi:hypothetical protein GJ496_008119 [Pomphorhynchus laevis]|nr:hypothetical protein GJ496_008119 [Pomphorhynchus laevis]
MSIEQVLVISRSGKLVYSSGKSNNDNDLSQSAVLLALIAVVESFDNDALSEIHSTKSIVVLEFCDPLILAAWIPSCESSIYVTRRILRSLFDQIVTTLTLSYMRDLFVRKNNCDFRAILSGTERMLDALCSLGSENRYDKLAISIMMNAVHCMSIPHSIRFKVNGLLQSHFNLKGVIFALLLHGDDLISSCRLSPYILHTSDINLLINFIKSSNSLKSIEAWLPFCLPKFDTSGFVHAYVCYINNEQCSLIVLTTETEGFSEISSKRCAFEKKFKSLKLNDALSKYLSIQSFPLCTMPTQLRTSGIIHFLYKSKDHAQYVLPRKKIGQFIRQEYFYMLRNINLIDCYVDLQSNMGRSKSESIIIWKEEVCLVAKNSKSFQLFASFDPSLTEKQIRRSLDLLLTYFRAMQSTWFITDRCKF